MVVSVSVIFYTPILDKIPGYPGIRSRNLLIENIERINMLEKEVAIWNKYRDNIIRIMDGATPVDIPQVQNIADSIGKIPTSFIAAESIDSLFRATMLSNRDNITEKKSVTDLSTVEFFLPVKGVVTKNYNLKDNFNGVEFTVTEEEPVLAVNRGKIVLTTWSLNEGHIIQLQHGNGLITTYKNLSHTIKNVGETVEGGEVIGYVGERKDSSLKPTKENTTNSKQDIKDSNNNDKNGVEIDGSDNVEESKGAGVINKSTLILEFWRNGNSIDPTRFLIM